MAFLPITKKRGIFRKSTQVFIVALDHLYRKNLGGFALKRWTRKPSQGQGYYKTKRDPRLVNKVLTLHANIYFTVKKGCVSLDYSPDSAMHPQRFPFYKYDDKKTVKIAVSGTFKLFVIAKKRSKQGNITV